MTANQPNLLSLLRRLHEDGTPMQQRAADPGGGLPAYARRESSRSKPMRPAEFLEESRPRLDVIISKKTPFLKKPYTPQQLETLLRSVVG